MRLKFGSWSFFDATGPQLVNQQQMIECRVDGTKEGAFIRTPFAVRQVIGGGVYDGILPFVVGHHHLNEINANHKYLPPGLPIEDEQTSIKALFEI